MRRLLVLLFVILFAAESFASLPQIKSYDKQDDLIDGQAKNVSITWEGKLLLAPITRQVFDSERPFIWDFVADSKGNLFVATGDGATISYASPDGKTKILSQWRNSEVYSLALDNKGTLYAGTSPDGKIYRVYQDKEPELFVDLKVKYIWDILFDKQNKCYVATGDSGTIYMIDERGKASVVYRSDETHIRCLTWDNNDQLLAGSYPNGYIFRINSSGQAFVIYDSDFPEIHKICVARDGTIYAAGLGQETPKASVSKQSGKAIIVESSADDSELIAISPKPMPPPKISKSGIIKIQPNGIINDIWQSNSDQVQSIALMEDQSLLVGTGDKGRLFKFDAQDDRTYLLNFEASQIVALKPGVSGKIWIATSNLGKIFQLESEFEKQGIYESEVFDAKTLTHWGAIHWEEQLPAGCNVKLFCRSGNTEKQNGTWSPWIETVRGDVIKSPAARFIQWKLELSTNRSSETPEINNVRLCYLQQNLPPEILSITVHEVERKIQLEQISTSGPIQLQIAKVEEDEDESGAQRPPTQPGVKRQLQNGYRRISWIARDKNNDQLSYDLYFQEENDQNWWALKKDLTRTYYTWDSRMMPDGDYRIKVVANDSKSNPINTAKQAEKLSDWFVVDNTGPEIEPVKVKKLRGDSIQVSFTVIDKLSQIKQVQFSYDLENWLWVYPADMVCDSKKELFQFDLEWKPNQFHSIVVKAQDSSENTSYSRINLKE